MSDSAKSRTAAQTLDNEYLLVRAKLLEIAASLDRIERADGTIANDPRISQIQTAIAILQATTLSDDSNAPNRAEELQLTFSLPYETGWQSEFGLA
jgi:hypothetical protein